MIVTKFGYKIGAISTIALVFGIAIGQGPGDLIITPTRLTLDGKNKTGDITLLNRGSQPVRYRLRFVDMEMSEEGGLQRLQEKSKSSGIDFFRLSPREILLQPGEYQRIKVLADFPAGTKDGEFRSHLAFEPIMMPREGQTSPSADQSINIKLELRSVVTIPVIARHGQVSAVAALSNGQIETDEKGWLAKFTISRSGNKTVRGDVVVSFFPNNKDKPITLGEISGLPVYFPNESRKVSVRLTQDISKLGKGKIEVEFIDPERTKGSPILRTTIAIVE